MPSAYLILSNYLNYHKGFSCGTIVIKNNRINYSIYGLPIENSSPGQELYMVKFTALNSKYEWVF